MNDVGKIRSRISEVTDVAINIFDRCRAQMRHLARRARRIAGENDETCTKLEFTVRESERLLKPLTKEAGAASQEDSGSFGLQPKLSSRTQNVREIVFR